MHQDCEYYNLTDRNSGMEEFKVIRPEYGVQSWLAPELKRIFGDTDLFPIFDVREEFL